MAPCYLNLEKQFSHRWTQTDTDGGAYGWRGRRQAPPHNKFPNKKARANDGPG